MFYGITLAAKHLFPPTPEDVLLYAVLFLLNLVTCLLSFRRRLWLNAVLAFSISAIPLVNWPHVLNLPDPKSSLIWPFLLIFLLPTTRSLCCWERALVAGLVLSGILQNAGLLGSGAATSVVGLFSYLGVAVWMAIQWRRRETEQTVFTSAEAA